MSHSGSSRSSGPAISHVTIPVIGRPVMTMDFAIIPRSGHTCTS